MFAELSSISHQDCGQNSALSAWFSIWLWCKIPLLFFDCIARLKDFNIQKLQLYTSWCFSHLSLYNIASTDGFVQLTASLIKIQKKKKNQILVYGACIGYFLKTSHKYNGEKYGDPKHGIQSEATVRYSGEDIFLRHRSVPNLQRELKETLLLNSYFYWMKI